MRIVSSYQSSPAMNEYHKTHFFKKDLVDTCPFMGPLIPLFSSSGDISSGFQSQSGQPHSHLVETYHRTHLKNSIKWVFLSFFTKTLNKDAAMYEEVKFNFVQDRCSDFVAEALKSFENLECL